MKVEDMIIISVDDHIVEPPTLFDNHLTQAQKAFAPKVVRDKIGRDIWYMDGRVLPNPGTNAVVGNPPEEYGMEPLSYDQIRKGVYDVHARIDDMNVNGIVGSLCFGSIFGFEGGAFINAENKDHALTLVKAYNDWHIDEWCGAYPGRFIPCAIVPLWDIKLIVEEIQRVVKKGCRAISFTDNPAAKKLPSLHSDYWEPLWKICADEGVIICNHIGSGNVPPHPSLESPIDVWITGMPISVSISAADWLHLDALLRYPTLKIAISEGGIGWVPYLLERADFTYSHHHAWTHSSFGGKRPSEVFREHFITCFIDDHFGVMNRNSVGVDIITYECDYPHSDCLWPDAPERLMANFSGVSDVEIDKITHLNAMREFHFDPISMLGRKNCTVGALRAQAQHVDTTPVSHGAPKPLPDGQARRVTSGDVMAMVNNLTAGAQI